MIADSSPCLLFWGGVQVLLVPRRAKHLIQGKKGVDSPILYRLCPFMGT